MLVAENPAAVLSHTGDVARKLCRRPRVAEAAKSDVAAAGSVVCQQGRQVEGGDGVGGQHEQGLPSPGPGEGSERPAGAERDFLSLVGDLNAQIGETGERLPEGGFVDRLDVHRDRRDAGYPEPVDRPADQRDAEDGQERFRASVRDGYQPRAISGREHQSAHRFRFRPVFDRCHVVGPHRAQLIPARRLIVISPPAKSYRTRSSAAGRIVP